MPPEMRTRATLRSAEFGFLGVVVYTRVQTPRRCGAATFFLRPLPDFRPGVASFLVFGWRPLRICCEVVGMRASMLAVAAHSASGQALQGLLGREDLEALVTGDRVVRDAPRGNVEAVHEAGVRAQRAVHALARQPQDV